MPTFEFDDGGAGANQTTTVTSANAALNFTEDGVDFTFSTVNPSGTAALYYSPGAAGGALSFSDFNNTGMFTLAVNAATNNLLRNPALNVATISGTWTVTFVHATRLSASSGAPGSPRPTAGWRWKTCVRATGCCWPMVAAPRSNGWAFWTWTPA